MTQSVTLHNSKYYTRQSEVLHLTQSVTIMQNKNVRIHLPLQFVKHTEKQKKRKERRGEEYITQHIISHQI